MILTIDEAIAALGEYDDTVDTDRLSDDLAAVEAYILRATGYTATAPVDPVAKKLAKMLLTQWWDNPDGQTSQKSSDYGVQNLIVQLRANVALEAEA